MQSVADLRRAGRRRSAMQSAYRRVLPKVAVVGVGGVGGTVAASLATAGTCDLTCVTRGIGLDTIRRSGLRVTLHDGEEVNCTNITAVDARGPVTASVGAQDIIFLTTKAHQIAGALDSIAPLVDGRTSIVPLQNGLPWWFFAGRTFRNPPPTTTLSSIDPGAALFEALPPSQVVGAVGFVAGSTRDEGMERQWFDGKVRGRRRWFSNWPPERSIITLGELEGSSGGSGGGGGGSGSSSAATQRRAVAVAGLFTSSRVRLPTRLVDDIHSAVFSKLLVVDNYNL